MTLLYRLLGVIVNVMAMLIGVALIFALPIGFSHPELLLNLFALVCLVLYAWFSSRFHRFVLKQHRPVKKKLRDWVHVNGIVAVIASLYSIGDGVVKSTKPSAMLDEFKRIGIEITSGQLKQAIVFSMFLSLVWIIHVLWTFALIKKFRNYFQE